MRNLRGTFLALVLGLACFSEAQVLTPTVRKTVGVTSNVCSNSTEVTVARGTTVWYCYALTNDSPTNTWVYDIHDDQLGWVAQNATVAPLSTDYRLFSAVLNSSNTTVVNTATWFGRNVPFVSSAMATAHIFDPAATGVPALAPAGIVALGAALLVAGFVLLRRLG